MTIEAKIEENSNQLRQILIMMQDMKNIMVSVAGKPAADFGVGNAYDASIGHSHQTDASTTVVDDPNDGIALTTEDFGELDAMGCPFDPSIMSAGRTKNKTGKLAGCWKKKKDAEYTEKMYLEERRVLIERAASAASGEVEVEEITDTAPPPPPQTAGDTAPPPPPLNPVSGDITELPSVPNFDIITNDEFVELCRVFILKHGEGAAQCLVKNLTACGLAPASTPDQLKQQDQMSWVTMKVIDYDATHA